MAGQEVLVCDNIWEPTTTFLVSVVEQKLGRRDEEELRSRLVAVGGRVSYTHVLADRGALQRDLAAEERPEEWVE